mgnify:FL=1|jgi:hypothetical protein
MESTGKLAGTYFLSVNGGAEEVSHNLLTNEGMAYMLETSLKGSTASPKFYLAPYTNNYTPTVTLTAANFTATTGEMVNQNEGYTEAQRPEWKPGTLNGTVLDNMAAKAEFTFKSADSVTVYGMALLTTPTKGDGTGKLISITKFSKPRVMYDGDVLNVGYRIGLTTAG